MPALVIRLYEKHETAAHVVRELEKRQYTSDEIKVVRPGSSDAETVHAIRETGIPHVKASIYAEALTGDRALVVVNPPFGNGSAAEEVVDQFHPIEAGIGPRLHEATDYTGDATPFSRYFGWRVLLDNPTPLSAKFGWRVLSEKQGPSAEVNLSQNPAPLSSALGLRTSSSSAAPFSLRSGWKLLSNNATPLSDRFGWRTLSDKKLTLGDVELSNDPAPFSRLLGLPVLSAKQ
jgi:hypothetical protein